MGKVRKEIINTLKLGAPLVAAQLMQMSMNVADTIMAGNFSAEALAAIAVGNSLWVPLLLFVLGTLLAINPIVAQLFGGGKKEQIGKNLWQGLWLGLFLSVPGFFMVRNMSFIMDFFNIQPEIIPTTLGYLNAISWCIPAQFCYFALRFFNEGIHIAKPSMYFAIIGAVINIFANYVFMFGHLGFPAMGPVGTGWATTLVWWMILIGMILFTFRKKIRQDFQILHSFDWPHWKSQKEILKIGIPNGFSFGIEVTMFAVVALIIGSMGVNQVAAHQVTINFAALAFMIPLGLSFAITARVGFAVGKNELDEARFIGYIGIAISTLVMCLTALFMLALPEVIIGVYTKEDDVARIAVNLLFFAAIFQISDGLQVSGLAALRGLKDTKIPMLVNVVAYWVVGLPLGYLLGINYALGPAGLWIGLILGLSVAAVLHNLRFYLLTNGEKLQRFAAV
ncbi:MATE family efflux transporter [candidate division KSB1 bacterium]|nr:MATE family efflux transporter [candidate division KSB1 bacterium]